MSARQPSTAELLRALARDASGKVPLPLPGIVESYNAVLGEADCRPAVFAPDERDAPSPVTCQWRQLAAGGVGVFVSPLPGDHCTIVYHGLDAAAFFAAPSGSVRADLVRGAGVTSEAWPASYGPGVPSTPGWLCLGSPLADAPLVRGTDLVVWMGQLAAVLAAAPGGPITMPAVPATLLSTTTMTA